MTCVSGKPRWPGARYGERKFRSAVETEMARARQKRMGFGEVGGWAIAEERRGTMDPLRMVLATCGLFRLLGGCIGVATATVRHGSSTILRRIGLRPFALDGVELPPYYDPRYGCEMEALRFDSDFPSPKYASAIDELMSWMKLLPVICREEYVPEWFDLLRGVDLPAARPAAMPSLQPLPMPQPSLAGELIGRLIGSPERILANGLHHVQ